MLPRTTPTTIALNQSAAALQMMSYNWLLLVVNSATTVRSVYVRACLRNSVSSCSVSWMCHLQLEFLQDISVSVNLTFFLRSSALDSLNSPQNELVRKNSVIRARSTLSKWDLERLVEHCHVPVHLTFAHPHGWALLAEVSDIRRCVHLASRVQSFVKSVLDSCFQEFCQNIYSWILWFCTKCSQLKPSVLKRNLRKLLYKR